MDGLSGWRQLSTSQRIWLAAVLAGLLLVFLGVLLFLFGPNLPTVMFGAWMTIWTFLAGLIVLLVQLARHIVGPGRQDEQSYRTVAVCIALLIACLAVPPAVKGGSDTLARFAEAAFIVTPEAVSIEVKRQAYNEADLREAGVTNSPTNMLWEQKGRVQSELYNYIAHGPEGAGSALGGSKAGADGRRMISADAGIWFLIIFAAALLIARALSEARATMEDRLSGVEHNGRRPFAIVSYPKWVAMCIYAVILAPATYCAIGSLLYLSLDQADQDLSSVSESLNRAEGAAMTASPALDVDTAAVVNALTVQTIKTSLDAQATVTQGKIVKAVADGRAMNRNFESWRASYKSRALEQATHAKRAYTASQFQDYVARLSGDYTTAIIQSRLEVRGCLQVLGDIKSVVTAQNANIAQALKSVDGLANQVETACPSARSAALRDPPRASNCTDQCSAPSPATADAQGESPAPPGALRSVPDSTPMASCDACDAPFYRQMYAWLADAPQAAVRIVGLIGFGLFGAAIRMMGRPDEVPSYAALDAAQRDLDQARLEVEQATEALQDDQQKAQAAIRERTDITTQTTQARNEVREHEQALAQRRGADPTAEVADEEEILAKARETVDDLAAKEQAATAKVELVEKAVRDAEILREEARRKAQAAATILQSRRRALLEDRNSIVVDRPVPDDKALSGYVTEYTLSGAPARVFVQGLGAAFTVFLAGESGVKLLTDDGRTSAVGLMLACFVGAVFAQEIWRAAYDALTRRANSATPTPPPP